ncbi:uncharacterized protein LOC143856523 isoform X3 [Tasmannia lanceolata]
MAVETFLIARGKVEFIKRDPPPPDDKSYAKWIQEDAVIRILLWNSMEPIVGGQMMYLNSSKEIWQQAETLYSGVNSMIGIFNVYSKLLHLKRDDDKSVADFYCQFVALYQQLDMYLPFTTDPIVLAKRQEDLRVLHFLDGLGPDFVSIRQQIVDSGFVPSLNEVFSRVQGFMSVEGSTESTLERSALAAQFGGSRISRGGRVGRGRGRRGRGGGQDSGGGRGSRFCTHCGQEGHSNDFCYALHPELRSSKNANASVPVAKSSTPSSSAEIEPRDSFVEHDAFW